jgi:hypothetical protein
MLKYSPLLEWPLRHLLLRQLQDEFPNNRLLRAACRSERRHNPRPLIIELSRLKKGTLKTRQSDLIDDALDKLFLLYGIHAEGRGNERASYLFKAAKTGAKFIGKWQKRVNVRRQQLKGEYEILRQRASEMYLRNPNLSTDAIARRLERQWEKIGLRYRKADYIRRKIIKGIGKPRRSRVRIERE